MSDEQRRDHDRLQVRIDRAVASGPPLDLEAVRSEALRRYREREAYECPSPASCLKRPAPY